MLDRARDNAIADHKTYGSVEAQHRLFAELRRDDPVHWTQPDGYRPFWTITKYADIVEIERQAVGILGRMQHGGECVEKYRRAAVSASLEHNCEDRHLRDVHQ